MHNFPYLIKLHVEQLIHCYVSARIGAHKLKLPIDIDTPSRYHCAQ